METPNKRKLKPTDWNRIEYLTYSYDIERSLSNPGADLTQLQVQKAKFAEWIGTFSLFGNSDSSVHAKPREITFESIKCGNGIIFRNVCIVHNISYLISRWDENIGLVFQITSRKMMI